MATKRAIQLDFPAHSRFCGGTVPTEPVLISSYSNPVLSHLIKLPQLESVVSLPSKLGEVVMIMNPESSRIYSFQYIATYSSTRILPPIFRPLIISVSHLHPHPPSNPSHLPSHLSESSILILLPTRPGLVLLGEVLCLRSLGFGPAGLRSHGHRGHQRASVGSAVRGSAFARRASLRFGSGKGWMKK